MKRFSQSTAPRDSRRSGLPKGSQPLVRRRWHVAGRVQGVGFRPFVYRLAKTFQITGSVWNDAAGAIIEGQGTELQLSKFARALESGAPAAAAIRQITEETIEIRTDENEFEIGASQSAGVATAEITADLALCDQCAAEIRDAAHRRRFQYALNNCTNCGPRFSIVRTIPYDRPNTSMAAFAMCNRCRVEYSNPADRRFHAQPVACHDCGPKLTLIDNVGQPLSGDPIEQAARMLAVGKIVAIKGIGGFHLAVRADDQRAVDRLREVKNRPAKPFALMCGTLKSAERLVALSDQGVDLITSPAAPIVLATRMADALVAKSVALASHRLGVMIAYSPLHHLLFDLIQKLGIETLVMTSGNDSDEPLVFRDEDVVPRLGFLCDAILTHNRPIVRSVDDSVVIDGATGPIYVRRSRGYAPEPVELTDTRTIPAGLAVGAEMKSTIGVFRNEQVILSQHLGTVTDARAFDAFKQTIGDMCELFSVSPQWIAHDLHPVYLSTQHAAKLADEWNTPLIGVQHHHAHAAAVLAEHGISGPTLAVVCDGTGFGTDRTIWGGELLVADLCEFTRVARLRPISLPGGDAASKQPWRSAIALLHQAFGDDFGDHPICAKLAEKSAIEFVKRMVLNHVSCVASSSTGRIFDGVAALLGLCLENRFDAEAPAALEAAAANTRSVPQIDSHFLLNHIDGITEIDLSPLVRRVVYGVANNWPVTDIAMFFHVNLASAWAAVVERAIHASGLKAVELSGGVFCNELFSDLLTQRLEKIGATVLRRRVIPPNDGGIAFGQAAVATARLRKQKQ
jgi:hydrogenase maturation protein HypF